MSIWQKRVLIFLLKFFGVILIIAVIALFLYYNFYFKKDSLLKYAPKNSLAFASFRINNSFLQNQAVLSLTNQLQEKFKINIDLNILNPLVGYNAAIAVIPNNNYDYLLILNLKTGVKDISEIENHLLKNNLYYEHLIHDRIERNILIVSNSLEVIKQVKKINVQEAPSLADRVEVVLSLQSIPINYQGKIFIDLQALKEAVNQTNNVNLKLLLANFQQKELYLNIKDSDNKIIVKSFKHDTNKNKQIISEKLPADYVVNLILNHTNLNYENYLEKLSKIDKNYTNSVNQQIKFYEQLYKFDLQTDILDLLKQQAQFIVMQDNKWLILANLANNNDITAKIKQIEYIIKEHLAYNNPIEVEKQLPDKTYIRQIIKQSNKLDFEIQDIKGLNLNYLRKNGEEYAYFIIDDVLYLANNRQILINMLNDNQTVSLADISNCYSELPNFSQNLFVNNQNLTDNWLFKPYFDHLLFSQQINNDEIWLCLE